MKKVKKICKNKLLGYTKLSSLFLIKIIMNKLISISIIFFLIVTLSSCFQNNEAVNNAKKDLWIINDSNQEKNIIEKKEANNITINKQTDTPLVKEEKIIKKQEKFIIKSLTMNNFIELDDLKTKTFPDWEIEITWKTLLNVDKIVVSFINKTSSFPIDNYTLKQFKSGDKTFTYRAFSRYQTLDYGENEYIFTAYSWKDISKLSLIINIDKQWKDTKIKENNVNNDKISYEKKKIWGDNNFKYLNFPKSNSFWEMISTWNNSFTYSKIDNLSVEKKYVSNINCQNITESLKNTINSWFYWNTCRNIIKDKWIKFNIIRLQWDKYFYERHYIDYNNSLYGIFLIETWTGVTSDSIKVKNDELKAKDFTSIKLVDNLFYEIVR